MPLRPKPFQVAAVVAFLGIAWAGVAWARRPPGTYPDTV